MYEFLDQAVPNTNNEAVRMGKWYVYKQDIGKHMPFAIFTNAAKLQ